MLTHLALNDWSEVLEEDSLPFRERLAIAFQFLDDKAVTSYLRRCLDRAISKGDIDALIVPGLKSKAGMDLLQGYIDRTGDIQSAAILGSYVSLPVNPGSINRHRGGTNVVQMRVGKWVEGYRDLLDGFRMFHTRVSFDIERGQVALENSRLVAVLHSASKVIGSQSKFSFDATIANKPVTPEAGSSVDAAQTGTARVKLPLLSQWLQLHKRHNQPLRVTIAIAHYQMFSLLDEIKHCQEATRESLGTPIHRI